MKKFWYLMACILIGKVASTETKPPSLSNFGATCYLNSTIQCLYNIDYLSNYALFTARIDPYPVGSLASTFLKLIKGINILPDAQAPTYTALRRAFWDNELKNFVEQAYNIMNSCGQEDAPSFFVKLMDNLVSQDARYKNLTTQEQLRQHPFGKVIVIENASTIHCPDVGYNSTKKEPYTHLDVEVRKFDAQGNEQLLTTLEQCLNNYYTQETLSDYTPEGFPTQHNCTKKIEIAELSDIVVIVPKRFTFDMFTGASIKLDHEITVPLSMSFRKYLTPSARQKKVYMYDLIAVAEHMGGTGGGHYIAHVKEIKSGQWYTCNDSVITAVNAESIKNNIDRSYVFVYRKNEKMLDEPVKKIQPAPKITAKEMALTEALQQLTKSLRALESML